MSNEPNTISIFDKGALFNLTIGTWSGRKMLSDEDMRRMGQDPDALPADIVNYGRKLLVPKSELQKITTVELKARNHLRKYSVPFGATSARFVPITKLASIEAQLIAWREEFFEAVDSFVKRFGDMRQAVQDAHPEFYDRCLKNHYPGNPAKLREKFRFDWATFKMSPFDIQETDYNELIVEDKVRQEMLAERRKMAKEQAGKFMEEYVGTLRKGVVDFCELMTARVQGKPYGEEDKSKKLTGRTIGTFRKAIQKFKDMNIWGDDDIDKMLTKFRDDYLDEGASVKDLGGGLSNDVAKALKAIREKAEEDVSSQFGGLKRKVVI